MRVGMFVAFSLFAGMVVVAFVAFFLAMGVSVSLAPLGNGQRHHAEAAHARLRGRVRLDDCHVERPGEGAHEPARSEHSRLREGAPDAHAIGGAGRHGARRGRRWRPQQVGQNPRPLPENGTSRSFTSPTDREGTGLGLVIARGLPSAGGSASVRSEPGRTVSAAVCRRRDRGAHGTTRRARAPQTVFRVERRPGVQPWLAGLLSLVLPGLGSSTSVSTGRAWRCSSRRAGCFALGSRTSCARWTPGRSRTASASATSNAQSCRPGSPS